MNFNEKIFILLAIYLLLFLNVNSKILLFYNQQHLPEIQVYMILFFPKFGQIYGVEVRVIAVGTGQAIENSRRCDADVLIAHHKESEEKFIAEGYGLYRKEFMYNDFVLVGPKSDPAGVQKVNSIVTSLELIRKKGSTFVSRGDNSGTHKKEFSLWQMTGSVPEPKVSNWYYSVGQGMGGALNFAVNKDGYILTDRSTWESFKNKKHMIVVENEPLLFNYYGVIPINPEKCPDVKIKKVKSFVDWLLSDKAKLLIKSFKINNKQLFFPIK